VLADSELELVPPDIISHPVIQKSARKEGKKPGDMLLDSSLHHQALHHLPQGNRRGRPDIIHIFLLLANESILNRQGMLQVYIHTRNNEIITVNPLMRVIKNYNRFKGLCEQLFREKIVPSTGDILMTLEKAPLKTLLKKINPDITLLCSPRGKKRKLQDYFQKKNIACIIGGFPKGDFLSRLETDVTLSLNDTTLPAWIAAVKIIVTYENHLENPG
jgi:rRNA small subunit pseudouridine methyltransferase Nep1